MPSPGEQNHDVATLPLRCPRCKLRLTSDHPETLAEDMLAHTRAAHGHTPAREHVLSRIERHNRPDE